MSSRRRKFDPSRPVDAGRRGQLVVGLGLALTLVLGPIACQSGPVRAFQGARYYAAGSDALERGDSDRAILELRRAAERVPHASEIQNHLGLAYLSKGETEEARAAFQIALELDCDNRAAQMNLARLVDRSRVIPEGTGAAGLRAQQHPASNAVDGEGGENHGG